MIRYRSLTADATLLRPCSDTPYHPISIHMRIFLWCDCGFILQPNAVRGWIAQPRDRCQVLQALFQLPVDEASTLLKTAKDVLDSWYTTYMLVRASAPHV